MDQPPDSFLSQLRTARARLLASTVLRPSGILRQPDLPTSRSARSTGRSTPGCQSQSRPARQAYGDLRPADAKQYSGKLQTEIEDLHLGKPVMRRWGAITRMVLPNIMCAIMMCSDSKRAAT